MAAERWISAEMRECLARCLECHSICMETVTYSLEMGGRYAAVEHVRLLLDCAELCKAAVDFISRGSDLYKRVCGLCAQACDLCARSCESVRDPETNRCAEVCRDCASSARGTSHLGVAA